jgi:hypothetical protein
MKLTVNLTKGRGNISDDASFNKGTLTRFKKELARRMTARMKARKLTLQTSSDVLECDVDEVRLIRKSEVASMALPYVLQLANRLGFSVQTEVTVPQNPANRLH